MNKSNLLIGSLILVVGVGAGVGIAYWLLGQDGSSTVMVEEDSPLGIKQISHLHSHRECGYRFQALDERLFVRSFDDVGVN
ncbi:hypothetical protein LCGC14_3163700, partial [marine sediment metagenome]